MYPFGTKISFWVEGKSPILKNKLIITHRPFFLVEEDVSKQLIVLEG
jgi:hypothetical protein